jgi:hypothetical protein
VGGRQTFLGHRKVEPVARFSLPTDAAIEHFPDLFARAIL